MSAKLAQLCAYLDRLQGRDNLSKLETLLHDAVYSFENFEELAAFSDEHYVRNKVRFNTWYDMWVICWKPGQYNPIHDHTDSSCAFKILKGTATEIIYQKTGRHDDLGEYVRQIEKRSFATYELCLAQDDTIHRIVNESQTEDLVTLHIYSPPLAMKFYEEEGETRYKPVKMPKELENPTPRPSA